MVIGCVLVKEVPELKSTIIWTKELIVDQIQSLVFVRDDNIMEMTVIMRGHKLLTNNFLQVFPDFFF